MKIQQPGDLGRTTDPQAFIRYGSNVIKDTVSTVNGNLEFDVNLRTKTMTVNFTSANSDTAVTHSLGRTIKSYFPVSKNVSCDIYTGTTTGTSNTIYLRSTVAPATVTLVLF